MHASRQAEEPGPGPAAPLLPLAAGERVMRAVRDGIGRGLAHALDASAPDEVPDALRALAEAVDRAAAGVRAEA